MIGQFQVWNKKENRPATNNDVYNLEFYGHLKLFYDLDSQIVYPNIVGNESVFEIRKAPKE